MYFIGQKLCEKIDEMVVEYRDVDCMGFINIGCWLCKIGD